MIKSKPEDKLSQRELNKLNDLLEAQNNHFYTHAEMDAIARTRAKAENRKIEARDYLLNHDPTNPSPDLNCSDSRAFLFYLRLISIVKFGLIFGVAMIMLSSAIDGFLIYRIKFIVDSSSGILDPATLSSFAIILIVGMCLRSLMIFGSQLLFNRSTNKLSVDLSQRMFKQIAYMPQSFFDVHGHGKIISDVQNKVGGVTGATQGVILSVARDGSTVISFLVVMFVTHWLLSLVIFLMIPVLGLTLKMVTRAIRSMTQRSYVGAGLQVGLLNDMVKGHQVVNLYNAQDFEHGRFYKTLNFLRKMSEKGVVVSNLGHTFVQFFSSLILALIIYLSAHATEIGIPPISAGDFIVIFTSMFSLLKPVRNLTNVYTGFVSSLQATKSVLGILSLDTETDRGTLTDKEVNFKGDITYENVTFNYPSRPSEKILHNFNLTIEAGKTYAFVGKSGGGKSTIVSLLPRVYDVLGGAIKIDGHDIRDIKLHSLREHISVVSQQVHLFDDTIYNNIVYCDENTYSEEEVLEAARLAHVLDFTKDLPDGIHTKIGADGTRLSGGQRQRVSIARALLRKKPITVLDEATSALDNESEYFIQNSLTQLQEGRTVLVIAHRLSTIEKADQILVIKGGEIVERGTHNELVADTNGEYYKLYTRDFMDKKD